VGIRSEGLDDENDSTLLTFGANYYGAGHGATWSANFTTVDSDNNDFDGGFFQIGYTIGFSK
jgi:hypothetical protein